MFPRIVTSRSTSPAKRAASLAAAAGLTISWFTGSWLLSPAGAEDEISVHPNEVIVAAPGSVTVVATEVVPPELVGKLCDLRVVGQNGPSIHPGNNLIVTTGGTRTLVEGVEDVADGSVVGRSQVVVGDEVVIELEMGPDGASSLGFTVGLDCIPTVVPTTTISVPPTTVAQSTPSVAPAEQESTPTEAPAEQESTPTVLPAQQESQPLPQSPPATAAVATPTFTG